VRHIVLLTIYGASLLLFGVGLISAFIGAFLFLQGAPFQNVPYALTVSFAAALIGRKVRKLEQQNKVRKAID
jgi:multisubunit Na+/H+ antiporter MnhG subunit